MMLRHPARRLAMAITRETARRFGDRVGYLCVGGYPKSGTSWVSRIAAHCLGLPFVKPSPPVPQWYRCVLHHHWEYDVGLDRSIYVIRDGRDVMISLYANLMKGVEARRRRVAAERSGVMVPLLERVGGYQAAARRLERLFGRGFDPWDVERYLATFLEVELQCPLQWVVKEPWHRHVEGWLSQARRTVILRYERLLENPVDEFGHSLSAYVGRPFPEGEVIAGVSRYSFERQAGRRRGTEDRGSFFRKGIQGDWRNYFTKEAAEVFAHFAGRALVELGYEADPKWVDGPFGAGRGGEARPGAGRM